VAAAGRTGRIRLGPCVSPIYLRDPTYVAQLAATLDELSGGRAEVVLGIGNVATLEQYGIEWRGTRPIARLREALHVIRTLLDEGSIDFQGDFFHYTGVTTAARPVQKRVPLKVGAMSGPRSMELAGEIADGIHTACAYSPDALRFVVHHFNVGAGRAGRDGERLDIGDSLLGAIAPDPDVARRAGRVLASFYIPSMPPALLERHGIDPEEVAPVNSAFSAGNIERALDLTPDAVADRIMVAGTPDDWGSMAHRGLRAHRTEPRAPLIHRPLHAQGFGAPGSAGSAGSRPAGTTLRRTRSSPTPLEPTPGLEPGTPSLRVKCSAS
jgi:5,10-methylenetetrahydromethanopterin reductase